MFIVYICKYVLSFFGDGYIIELIKIFFIFFIFEIYVLIVFKLYFDFRIFGVILYGIWIFNYSGVNYYWYLVCI